ncbi:histone-lysine N-methyltransferase SETMAR [Trichonephila clavipes]|nr:histone-lysine N-methyltransferase SETMAR [Trichonephila clavipes]
MPTTVSQTSTKSIAEHQSKLDALLAIKTGTTVNDLYYTKALRTTVQHVKRKRPLLRNDFPLHHDNARPHIARCVLYISQQNNVDILRHPPYSLDLTPCDFWLFPRLKKPLRSKGFASNKACVKAALCRWF